MKTFFVVCTFTIIGLFVAIGCGSSPPLRVGPPPMHPPDPQNEWTPSTNASSTSSLCSRGSDGYVKKGDPRAAPP